MSDDALASPTVERPGSPSPWVSPSLAIGACPPLDRSISTASSVSSVSGRSSSSRLSDSGLPGRRRGYMRPEGTKFADSARNRESVQNLGTIAHLQYYFARTGLLDGKGAQLAKARKSGGGSGSESPSGAVESMSPLTMLSDRDAAFDRSELLLGDSQIGDGLVESPIDQEDGSSSWGDYQEPMMLPPTVSTYKNTPVYVPPPPDMVVLRRELREAMVDALQLLKELDKASGGNKDGATAGAAVETETQGWYEIQGLHFLDIVTLAIRAAKNYYTAHEQPQRLYSIKSERQIRKELYEVLDILKRIATRNFAGGVKPLEREAILTWASGIGRLLDTEEEKERVEIEEREKWRWREGDWSGKERDREVLFLRSFDPDSEELPDWTEPTEGVELPTPFLKSLQNGLRLVHLHNALNKKSRRQFEEIKHYHTDTAKPYRCADNLRYWIKAAQLRWDVKLDLLDVDVMAVVHGDDAAAWRKFDEALLKWCKGVREEIIAEWQEHRKASQSKTPTLRTSFAA
ncbi:uncharacterized protein BDZ99DRAFT_464912 [Mytilinidion resinicola]|uniref:Uncharacterized protein n=1 Tax=Mytilinidion resinicola TaxID=574789 RepID=A0A6A6YHF8_9PEZI|nr:uncharacterized protein BDZ99DRAFT_464912 [Mytilinidion resinicola]KAF2808018.1 hypothetical protein BDZ99DRAFT_464912 [Mytilinidion resinicola]